MLRLNIQGTGLTPVITLPKRSTEFAAGYDIYAPTNGVIPSMGQGLIKLGFMWAPTWVQHRSFPDLGGFFAKIFDRSGLAVKKRLNTLAGVIDTDYRDEWGLVITNNGQDPFNFSQGERLAQFVLLPFLDAEDLEQGGQRIERTGGFGSTGI